MKNKILISFIVLITILGCWNFAKAQSFNFWQYSGGVLKPAVKTWDVGVTDELRIFDNNHTNYVGFKGATNITSNQIWVLPLADGNANEVWSTNGIGDLDWLDVWTEAENTTAAYISATLTEEQVEDFVGGMLGGTETYISVDYQDITNDIDFVVDLSSRATLALDNLTAVSINTDLISDTDSTDDLGSTTSRWEKVYADEYYGEGSSDRILSCDTSYTYLYSPSNLHLAPQAGGSGTFDFSVSAAGLLKGPNNLNLEVESKGSGELVLDSPGGNIYVRKTFQSDTDSTDDLGTSSVYWANAYIDSVYLSANPTSNLQAATKEYVDTAVGFQFDYFFNNTSAGIGATGYFNMTDTDLGGAETTDLETTITNGVDDQELVEFISLSGQPGIEELSAGVYTFHFHAERTSGNSTVDAIYVKLYQYKTDTSEVLLGTSELTSEIVESKESYEIHTSIGSEITLDPTDRLLVKFFANTGSGGGSGSDVEIYAEGNTSSRFSFETTSAILSTLYIRQDGTTAFSGNQDFGTNDITGVGSLTLGTSSSADGTIIFQNATNANTLTIQTGATSGTYVLTLPLSVGGAGEVLTDAAGDGVLSWSAAGSGDVLAVGSCAEGLCLDGTSDGGTDITFYNIDSNKTQLIASDTASDLVITLPAATGILALLDSPIFTTAITVPNDSISAAELNEGDNFTWTGAHIFDGASLELPQDDTTDVVGETQLDTTDTTFIIHDGTANRVFGDDIYQFNFTIYADDAWDDEAVPIWIAPKDYAITIVQVHAATMGTTPSLAYNIEERAKAGLASAGTDIYAADEAADATGEDETSFSNAGIAAGAHLVLTTGSSSETGTVDLITGVVYYRKDVE